MFATLAAGLGGLGGTDGGGGGLITVVYIVFIIAIFYFLLIRPQKKQKKEREEMMGTLNVGDDVYTAGGILGTITRIKERTVWLRVSEKCEIELLKSSIGGVQSKESEAELQKN